MNRQEYNNLLYSSPYYSNSLAHHGIIGQRWGVRRYQNEDGSLTPAGKKRYLNPDGSIKSDRKADKLADKAKFYDKYGDKLAERGKKRKAMKNWKKSEKTQTKLEEYNKKKSEEFDEEKYNEYNKNAEAEAWKQQAKAQVESQLGYKPGSIKTSEDAAKIYEDTKKAEEMGFTKDKTDGYLSRKNEDGSVDEIKIANHRRVSDGKNQSTEISALNDSDSEKRLNIAKNKQEYVKSAEYKKAVNELIDHVKSSNPDDPEYKKAVIDEIKEYAKRPGLYIRSSDDDIFFTLSEQYCIALDPDTNRMQWFWYD